MNNGWIKLHRKILDNPISHRPQWAWIWVVLLLLASHDDKESFIFDDQQMHLKKGQFITGRKKLSQITGVSETTVERVLDYLEKSRQIGQQKNTKNRVITILNWELYQNVDNKRTTNGQQTDTIKNIISKEDKKNTVPSIPFEQFWDIYPKKVDKKKSEEKWGRLPYEVQLAILKDIPARQQGRQWQEGYIPHPTTYLNGERWTDQIEVPLLKTGSLIIK